MEENLSIGNETEDNLRFYDTIDIAVNAEDDIFILDTENCRVQKFDKNGNFLQTIGRKGQGPGEFEYPSNIILDLIGNIYVQDGAHKTHLFDIEGNFKKTIVFRIAVGPGLQFIEDDLFLSKALSISPGRFEYTLVLIDLNGKAKRSIISSPVRVPPQYKGHSLYNPYFPRLNHCIIADGLAVYGDSSEYELSVFNSAGDILYQIEKDSPNEIFKKEEKEAIINEYMKRQEGNVSDPKLDRSEVQKRFAFPKYKPCYMEILNDEKGRIYLRLPTIIYDKSRTETIALFCKQGYFIHRIYSSIFPKLIRNGNAYTIVKDKDTEISRVIRYKITSWDQIKEGIQ